jgi:hypothetical protein
LKFLHEKAQNIRIDYKLFLSQVVKYLNYDTLLFYPLPANKKRWEMLTDLWKEFLDSRFVRDTSSYLGWEKEILETFSATLIDRVTRNLDRPVIKCNKLKTITMTKYLNSK